MKRERERERVFVFGMEMVLCGTRHFSRWDIWGKFDCVYGIRWRYDGFGLGALSLLVQDQDCTM